MENVVKQILWREHLFGRRAHCATGQESPFEQNVRPRQAQRTTVEGGNGESGYGHLYARRWPDQQPVTTTCALFQAQAEVFDLCVNHDIEVAHA